MGNSSSESSSASESSATSWEEVQGQFAETLNLKVIAWFDLFCQNLGKFYIEDILENPDKYEIPGLQNKFELFYTDLYGYAPPSGLFTQELAKRCRSEYNRPYQQDYQSNLGYWEMRHILWMDED